jgi:hypothetical protein
MGRWARCCALVCRTVTVNNAFNQIDMNKYLQQPLEAPVARDAFNRGERVFRQWNTSVVQIGRMRALALIAEVAVTHQVSLTERLFHRQWCKGRHCCACG